jgi:hypothetical protein
MEEYFGKIEPIYIQRGIIQGNMLSPYLFILFLKPLLRWVQTDQNGYTFCTSKIHECEANYRMQMTWLP